MGIILVTGGMGYIGSHTCVALLQAGYSVVILDNLSNSCRTVLDRIEGVCAIRPTFVEGDVRDAALLDTVFSAHSFSAVLHFAGLKAVGESVRFPIQYFDSNVGGTLQLLKAMQRFGVATMLFSSSAAVYGNAFRMPIKEDFPCMPTNPYARSKFVVEQILHDLGDAEPDWSIGCLRYFNPVGAHESGLIGENPAGIPSNLMPYIAQVALGTREFLNVWGADYPTPDGTGIRDYIHVVDLAEGHLSALRYLEQHPRRRLTVNLGTGRGCSVLEVVRAFEQACGRRIPYRVVGRRPGDVAESWADPSLAFQLLGWRATRSLHSMCLDAWRWQEKSARDAAT